MSRILTAMLAITCLALAACAVEEENTAGYQDSSSVVEPQTTGTREASSTRSTTSAMVPEGTIIEVTLDETLDSGANRVGDGFTATVSRDVMVDGRRAIPAGSTVHGIVKACTPAKRGAGNASLTLAFSSLEIPGEDSVPMVAGVSDRTASKKKRNAAIIGGSAAGGAVLGRLIGKDTKGAVAGALAGGAIGTGVVMSKAGDQVHLPAGAALALRLDQTLRLPRQ